MRAKILLLWARLSILLWLLLPLSCQAASSSREITYDINIDANQGLAHVRISVPNNQWLRQLSINLSKRRLSHFKASGEVSQTEQRLLWQPSQGDAYLSYDVQIAQKRKQNGAGEDAYRAYIDSKWMIMRLDDLVPPFTAKLKKGRKVKAVLRFTLPDTWRIAYTSYPKLDTNQFDVLSERSVPRPSGWMASGSELGTRHERFNETLVSIVGPASHEVRPMELLALTGIVWPQFAALVKQQLPQKVLVVSANDPMWRGGLSADHSLFIHAARPLISENGTSTLVHELFHVLVGIRAAHGYDWITEGFAEFYAVDLLYRVHAYTPQRREEIFAGLERWGKSAQGLFTSVSSGAVTAKAAAIFAELDKEIKAISGDKRNLDDLVKLNLDNKKIDLAQIQKQFHTLTGSDSKVLARVEKSLAKPSKS